VAVPSTDGLGINALASLAAEMRERPIRITELSSSFTLREVAVRRWVVPDSSPSSSSSESVKYESISRNSARIFVFLILRPVNYEVGVVLDRN